MHRVIQYLIFSLPFICGQFLYGQQSSQPLEYLASAKSFFVKKEYDSTYFLSKKAYTNFHKNNQDSLALVSALLLFESQPKTATKDTTDFYPNLIKTYKNRTKWEDRLKINLAMGNGYFTAQEYSKALHHYIEIDSIAKQKEHISPLTIKSVLKRSEISRLTFTRESVEEAYNLARSALKDAKLINDEASEYLTYVYLSDLSGHVGKVEECKQYIDLALPYFKKEGNVEMASRLHSILNSYYLEKKDYKNVTKNFNNQLAYLNNKNKPLLLAKTYYYYGYFKRYRLKDYREALVQLDKSFAIYQNLNEKETLLYQRLLRDLASCHIELGNYEKASKFYQKAYDLKDDLTKKANRKRSKEVESKYKALQSEQEITLLSTQNELIMEQKESQQRLYTAGIILTALAGIFIFILFKNRQKTTSKLRELDTAKSHFFANISHELRTPLTLIKGHIQNKLSDKKIGENDKNDFQVVLNNTDRLAQLVNQILDISKIESGNMGLSISQVKPIEVINSIVHDFKAAAYHKQIDFDLDINNKNVTGWTDVDALQKIVTNLLSNALKFTPENGKIKVRADAKNSKLYFEIKNSGDGLTSEEKANIFKRFYQSQHAKGGTGIGLALVNELVKLHGGTIEVDTVENEFTKFSFNIALNKDDIKNATIKISPTTSKIKTNTHEDTSIINVENESNDELPILLIVEDNPDLGNLLQNNFSNSYRVIRALNGKEGCNIAYEKIPDIIISDVMMPIMDGTQLTEQLKKDERTSHIPIILLTAKAGDENTLFGLETGADDYITKPFNQKILATKVVNLLANRKRLQQRYSQEIVLKPKDIAVNSVDEQFLTKVQSVLDDNLVESEFTAEAFANAIEMSRMQLHRKLKALTGLSTTEFIRSQRLKMASQLLKKGDTNISQIGYAVGFSDPAYFTKCFKETYGLTPTNFLKKVE
ncbi:ATP-binding protein [Spongiivirga citrea]|uniref:histidine kinase n=1 Tax=Spongiivirga citrea TaxID=1481457 RepID=A0A6M0CT47_9FLAO|nr:ATP-binding protein [Spongiivirga citrea]NER18687.1 response regulator [Spongiivirga citrea]